MAAVPRRSAGILLHRNVAGTVEILLGHMGGPFWARKDAGAWTIPKGEPTDGEDLLACARREFTEELGLPVPDGEPVSLGEVRQRGGKVVTAWALHADLDPADVVPGTFSLQWPPGSGVIRDYPELDRVAWFIPDDARARMVPAQVTFVERLLAGERPGSGSGRGS